MTINDIARMAGVSSAAVSRYFNNGYVSEEKREAIRQAVEKTGYRPSLQAQTLRTRKTRTVGVIIPKVNNGSVGSIVDGILPVLEENGYQLMLGVTQNRPERELDYLNMFDEKLVDGIVFLGTVFTETHRKRLRNSAVPLVLVGQYLQGCYCVYQDEHQAVFDLTRLMLRKGKKNLAYISAPLEDEAAGLKRLQGYEEAVRNAGLPVLAERVMKGGFTLSSGYQKAKELWAQGQKPDGVICATDRLAMGCMEFVKEQGLKIPDDVMIAGLGDSSNSRLVTPSLTTIHYAYQEEGAQAARMLLDLIGKKETSVSCMMMKYSLVERESTGGPPADRSLDHWTEH